VSLPTLQHPPDPEQWGGKATRLAQLAQAGFAVPAGFVLPTALQQQSLQGTLWAEIEQAFAQLPKPVAVRSSATVEDLHHASFAGQGETILGVQTLSALATAIQQVWDSLSGERAIHYQQMVGLTGGKMAVLVQSQVAAKAAGVAFDQDPLDGDGLIIEAVAGLGEQLVSGAVTPQRWEVAYRKDGLQLAQAPSDPILSQEQILKLADLVQQVSAFFGSPQDVEWAWDGAQFWLLQARDITTSAESYFSPILSDDSHQWTAAFLNERFSQPVSPLGWSLIRPHLERFALREPLTWLGVASLPEPLTKLWRGQPYSRVLAWQMVYRLFPDWLLPEDAQRYFPQGDVKLRKHPTQPNWGFHLLWNGLKALWQSPLGALPFSNAWAWQHFERKLTHQLANWQADASAPQLLAHLHHSERLTTELLEMHRWSLLYADVSYSLAGKWLGGWREVLAAQTQTVTAQLSRDLQDLAQHAQAIPLAQLSLQSATDSHGLPAPLAQAIQPFLQRYGHRFFSLDIFDPNWSADYAGFCRLLAQQLAQSPAERAKPPARVPVWVRLAGWLLRVQVFLQLREAQRFAWQKILAWQRAALLQLGEIWTVEGRLPFARAIFGLEWQAVLTGQVDGAVASARLQELAQLRAQSRLAPGHFYPPFLLGNQPERPVRGQEPHDSLRGQAVSRGMGRGKVRLVRHAGELATLQSGDVLVTTSPDPAWTVAYPLLAGLVTERGGQLSHGAVVAREFGLPAVFGVAQALEILQDGQWVVVDGTEGVVLISAG
jgi:pyruvate,water dikinase